MVAPAGFPFPDFFRWDRGGENTRLSGRISEAAQTRRAEKPRAPLRFRAGPAGHRTPNLCTRRSPTGRRLQEALLPRIRGEQRVRLGSGSRAERSLRVTRLAPTDTSRLPKKDPLPEPVGPASPSASLLPLWSGASAPSLAALPPFRETLLSEFERTCGNS